MRSGRTLALTRDKTLSVVQSVHATTHSYIIQPVVNAKGCLLEPLLIVDPGSDGGFGVSQVNDVSGTRLCYFDRFIQFPTRKCHSVFAGLQAPKCP